MSELIVAENLHKCYGKVVAVKGLNLKVNEGSIMGLIGPNGAGKTTTIKIILGLLRPDEGKVAVFGENPWDNPKIREKIGVIYEKAYFPSHHKVLDYLKRTCRIFGVQESRAREVLELVDLDAYEREIRGLSAGMLQKFAIAHAVNNPPPRTATALPIFFLRDVSLYCIFSFMSSILNDSLSSCIFKSNMDSLNPSNAFIIICSSLCVNVD